MFASGLFIGMGSCTETEPADPFVHYDQYDPQYANYTDEQMSKLCEKHNLTYKYSDGECV